MHLEVNCNAVLQHPVHSLPIVKQCGDESEANVELVVYVLRTMTSEGWLEPRMPATLIPCLGTQRVASGLFSGLAMLIRS